MELVGIAIGGGLVAMLVLAYFSAPARARRQFRAATRHQVASFPRRGIGKVVGTLHAGPSRLTAPLTGRSCAAYHVVVEHKVDDYWRDLITEQCAVQFFLEDETGRASVQAETATVLVVFDSHTRSGTFDDPTAIQEAFLARHGQKSTNFLGLNISLRYREGVLEEGEPVAVLGAAMHQVVPGPPQDAGVYRGLPASILVFAPSSQVPLLISDDPDVTSRS